MRLLKKRRMTGAWDEILERRCGVIVVDGSTGVGMSRFFGDGGGGGCALGVGVFEADGFDGEEVADFAVRIALPAAAGEPAGGADGIPGTKRIGHFAKVAKEIERYEVDDLAAGLLEHDKAFAEAFLAKRFGGFDEMNLAGDDVVGHGGYLCRDQKRDEIRYTLRVLHMVHRTEGKSTPFMVK